MPKIAFDWQGTLDVHKNLYQMAIDLRFSGWEVIIISAMPITMQGVREKEIQSYMDGLTNEGAKLPYKVVYHELENYHHAAALKKVELMKQLEIPLLVDDTSEVVQTVREQGLEVLQI